MESGDNLWNKALWVNWLLVEFQKNMLWCQSHFETPNEPAGDGKHTERMFFNGLSINLDNNNNNKITLIIIFHEDSWFMCNSSALILHSAHPWVPYSEKVRIAAGVCLSFLNWKGSALIFPEEARTVKAVLCLCTNMMDWNTMPWISTNVLLYYYLPLRTASVGVRSQTIEHDVSQTIVYHWSQLEYKNFEFVYSVYNNRFALFFSLLSVAQGIVYQMVIKRSL